MKDQPVLCSRHFNLRPPIPVYPVKLLKTACFESQIHSYLVVREFICIRIPAKKWRPGDGRLRMIQGDTFVACEKGASQTTEPLKPSSLNGSLTVIMVI